jgi:hypothetical protein
MKEKWKKAITERKEEYIWRSMPLSNDVRLLCTCTINTRTAQWLSRVRIPEWTINFSPLENARSTLGTKKPPVQRVPELFPVGKAAGGEQRSGAVGWGIALEDRRSRVQLSMMSLEFGRILLPALWLNAHSASNRNEYQEYFLGVKVAGVPADNLTTFVCLFFKIWVPQTLETLRTYPGLYTDYFKAAGALSRPLIIIQCRDLAWVELYTYYFCAVMVWTGTTWPCRAIARAVCRRPVIAKALVRSQANPCAICKGQSGTSAFPCQYHSTSTTYLSIHLSSTLWT